ncbi:MAG: N-acetylmuramic acid 6-phosphate etherase [Acidobacteriota bacterium]
MSTEDVNPRTRELDTRTTAEIVRLINQEDRTVADAVAAVLPAVTAAVEGIVARLRAGGRLFYVGAGTSGRLGVLDAVECPPTFGVEPDRVIGVLAGGYQACHSAVEAAEDSEAEGRRSLQQAGCTGADAVVGIAASGRTPFTCGALRWARSIGAFTVGLANNRHSELGRIAHVAIEVETGPEVITGSTRMKAGTAQKMVLNMLSTAVMIRLGMVYDNLMVNVHLKNRKLRERGLRILRRITGAAPEAAEAALAAAGDVPTAAVMLSLGCSVEEARSRLQACSSLRQALTSPSREQSAHDP